MMDDIDHRSPLMHTVDCTEERHGEAMRAILNEAIAHSTAIYDYAPRPPGAMGPWFAAKRQGNWPVVGLEDDAGTLLGFASLGVFRAWPAYKYSAEHSLYVHHAHRRRGLGRVLLTELLRRAEQRGLHLLVGGIDAGNAGSIALHEQMGFCHAGTLRGAGFKFGRWLDLAFYQRVLPGPAQPVDG